MQHNKFILYEEKSTTHFYAHKPFCTWTVNWHHNGKNLYMHPHIQHSCSPPPKHQHIHRHKNSHLQPRNAHQKGTYINTCSIHTSKIRKAYWLWHSHHTATQASKVSCCEKDNPLDPRRKASHTSDPKPSLIRSAQLKSIPVAGPWWPWPRRQSRAGWKWSPNQVPSGCPGSQRFLSGW